MATGNLSGFPWDIKAFHNRYFTLQEKYSTLNRIRRILQDYKDSNFFPDDPMVNTLIIHATGMCARIKIRRDDYYCISSDDLFLKLTADIDSCIERCMLQIQNLQFDIIDERSSVIYNEFIKVPMQNNDGLDQFIIDDMDLQVQRKFSNF